ncbi:GtrA family protein [Pseudomonas sp. 18.1.10]|uniref:GtrA family protein n=1 Tax=Pseudomonas sp. 18.1.10 TaxID=2969302 RepID=UPI00214F6862|nr:GtrA family protein [Pseudomonas sp. 18.1.10]MCR4540779.1 GtrA family protein [Pseudomonas sp. 18.1.10]
MPNTLELLTRYLGAGCIATFVHLVIFTCLLAWCGPVISTLCASISGAGTAYCLARHWVFAGRQCSGVRFAVTAASQVAANTLIVGLLTHWGVQPHLAQLTALTAVTVLGFTINHLWVFKHDIKRAHSQ